MRKQEIVYGTGINIIIVFIIYEFLYRITKSK